MAHIQPYTKLYFYKEKKNPSLNHKNGFFLNLSPKRKFASCGDSSTFSVSIPIYSALTAPPLKSNRMNTFRTLGSICLCDMIGQYNVSRCEMSGDVKTHLCYVIYPFAF